jgi:hypothetical protein
MKEYEQFLLDEFNNLKEEYPALINTAKEYKEGFNIVLAAIERRTKAHKAVLTKWLKQKLS